MKFFRVTTKNIELLTKFLAKLANETTTFRYYKNRDVSVVKNHIYTCLLEVSNAEIVGYGHIDPEDGTNWVGVVIAEAYQGKGYGRLVIQHLYDKAKELGLHSLRLSCDIHNTKAQSLYKNSGFVQYRQSNGIVYMQKTV